MSPPREPGGLPPLHESWLPKSHVLYRPRHGKRQWVALGCAVVFLLLPAAAFALGVRPGSFENRKLTDFPSLSQGWSFFSQLSPWATDQLPLREQAIHAADGISQGVFGEQAPLGESGDQAPLPVGQSPPAAPSQFPTVLAGKDGWLYLGDELASHCDQSQSTNAIVAELDRLRAGVVASGRRFVVVIAPDKATMVPQYLPDDFVGKQCHASVTKQFWQAMSTQNFVLDLRGDLTAEGSELGAPVYGPQDAHWSDEGGVIMTRRIADALQPGLSSTWVVTPGQSWSTAADLPPLLGRTGTTTGRYYSILPDGRTDQTQPVDTDFAQHPVHLDTTSGPGTYAPAVGMLADSFTIRSARYLASAFGNLTIMQAADAQADHGVAVGQMLASTNAVVVEVAERTLVSGGYLLLQTNVQNTIIAELLAHPIH